jgi:acetylornithine deacetylase/succinyl-diaminopimelate desuccinylase-like protein
MKIYRKKIQTRLSETNNGYCRLKAWLPKTDDERDRRLGGKTGKILVSRPSTGSRWLANYVMEFKGKSDFTLLLYNHYDVQPEAPIELWKAHRLM